MNAPVIMMPDVDAVPALIRRDVPTSLVGFVGLERSGKDLLTRGSDLRLEAYGVC